MYPLFESICVIDTEVQLLELHIQRMQRSAYALWGRVPDLQHLHAAIKQKSKAGQQKVRVFYNDIRWTLEVLPYQPKQLQTVYLVVDDEIDYSLKYSHRQTLDKHKANLTEEEDIVIVKNNFLTDASYANLAFWNGEQWHTPSKPLLAGVKRQSLCKQNILVEQEIQIEDLKKYQKIAFINAMLSLGDLVLDITRVQLHK